MSKIFKNFRPYLPQVILIILLTAGQVMGTLQLPNIMSSIVNIGILRKGVTSGVGTTATQFSYIFARGAVMLLMTAFTMLCSIAAGYVASRVSAGIAQGLREQVFSRVERFSLADVNRFSIASLIIRTTNDIAQVQQISFMTMRIALISPFMAIGAIYMTIRTDAQLALIIAVAIPVLALAIIFVARKAMPLFRAVQKKSDRLNQVAREGLTGVRVIRAFNRQGLQNSRFTTANADLTDTTLRVNNIMVALLPLMTLMVNVVTIAIIWFGGKMIDTGSLQIGSLMAFLQYAMQLMTSAMMLSMIFIMLPRAGVSAERIDEVIATPPTILDSEHPRTLDGPASLVFDNVSFAFPGAEDPAVSGITFRAEAGTTTAIIGSTGAGKTTLMQLIERLYEPTCGTVSVNGCPVDATTQEELRNHIGYAPQRAQLFSGTIADNLRIGRSNASEEEMWEALTIAQARSFVEALPEGLASYVSQGGKNFSGGQKQRLAIARALIRKPDIYLFDDTFSALDVATDARLRAALSDYTRDAVVVMVAQRISSIVHADQIIVLDEGRIVGIGTHEELLAENTVYQDIAHSQLSEEELSA